MEKRDINKLASWTNYSLSKSVFPPRKDIAFFTKQTFSKKVLPPTNTKSMYFVPMYLETCIDIGSGTKLAFRAQVSTAEEWTANKE